MAGLDNINPERTLEDFQLILRTHSQCHNFTTAERKAVTLTTRFSEYRGQDCSDSCRGASLKRWVASVVRSIGSKHSWTCKNNCAQCVFALEKMSRACACTQKSYQECGVLVRCRNRLDDIHLMETTVLPQCHIMLFGSKHGNYNMLPRLIGRDPELRPVLQISGFRCTHGICLIVPRLQNLGARPNKAIAALNRIATSGTHVNTRCAREIK